MTPALVSSPPESHHTIETESRGTEEHLRDISSADIQSIRKLFEYLYLIIVKSMKTLFLYFFCVSLIQLADLSENQSRTTPTITKCDNVLTGTTLRFNLKSR